MTKSAMIERLKLREPVVEDGSEVWALVKRCKPLDVNSMYCNLVQVDQFSETCVVAELDGDIVGWISGHIIPGEDALFVWQVAVSPDARGIGLARKMLDHLVKRDVCKGVTEIRTTITEDNDASWALFRSFAQARGSELEDEPHYISDEHFDGRHDTEHMVTIKLRPALRRVA